MTKQGTVSVFRRMFILFMVVVVVIYGVIASLFIQYVRGERRVEENGLSNQVVSSAQVVQEQINAVKNVQLQLFSDPRMAQVSLGLFQDAYERSQLLLELIDYIQNTQRINSIIDDIILSFPREGVELSARNRYDRKDFSDPASYHITNNHHNQLVLNQEGNLELVLANPLLVGVDETYVPDFLIRIVLSKDHMQGILAPFCSTEYAGAFWIYSYNQDSEGLYTELERDRVILESWENAWTDAQVPQQFSDNIHAGKTTYFTSSCAIPDYNLVLIAYQDADSIAWALGKTLIYMAVIFVLMGVMFLMLILWANRSVSQPIRIIVEALEEVRSGKLSVRIFHKKKDEFDYIYDSFNQMTEHIEELINDVREQEALVQKAERIQLQSQINPHFLYNSFYNIKFMAKSGDYEQIETFVTALAKYYRFLNKETDAVIALADEAEHMEHFIAIQQMRFGDTISVDIQKVPEEVAAFRVPKLILQPLAENAYNYGFKNVLEGGRLSVKYHLDGNLLYIDIEDNGGNMDEAAVETIAQQMNTFSGEALNHALTNIQRRLKLNYGQESGLELAVGDQKGLRVRMILDTNVVL